LRCLRGARLRYIPPVTHLEPERLALKLQELIDRRAALHKVLQGGLRAAMTETERADIEQVLEHIAAEMAGLEQQLEDLRRRSGSNR